MAAEADTCIFGSSVRITPAWEPTISTTSMKVGLCAPLLAIEKLIKDMIVGSSAGSLRVADPEQF